MKAEEPATGILKTREDSFVVACDCTDPSHQHHVFVNVDDDTAFVEIYTTSTSSHKKSRWKLLWELLTKGFVQVETNILLDKQVALNYAKALEKYSKQP